MSGRKQKFAKQAQALSRMAKAGRKAQTGLREPNGRLSRAARKELGQENVNEIRRAREMAIAGVRDPIWGTQIGRLFLGKQVTPEQFGAARRWAELMEKWRAIHCGPRFNPKCGLASLLQGDPNEMKKNPGTGTRFEIKEDMDAHEATVTRLVNEAMDSFTRGSVDPTLVAVRDCVELDLAPVGFGGKLLLEDGLNHLATLWNVEG